MKQFLQTVMFLTLMLSSLTLLAQDDEAIVDQRIKTDHSKTTWFTEMNSAKPNYWKVKAAYTIFFEAHGNEKSGQQKLCRRWLQVNAGNIDKDGFLLPAPSADELRSSFARQNKIKTNAAVASNAQMASLSSTFPGEQVGSWRMIGPFHANKSKCGGISSSLSGGYTDRVYINPYNTTNMYAGTSYGGLWVSQDAGNSWSLSDAEFPNGTNAYANRDYYYGDIEASSQNAQLVYAATEAGLLRSANAGSSWNYCNELNRTVAPTTRPYFVAVSHDDQNTVLSSFGRKIYRSTDGGTSWLLVFDNSAGGANKKFANVHTTPSFGISDRTYNFWGLDFHPTDPNIVYIGMWNAANEPCIYKSTDKGGTFSFLMNIIQSSGRVTGSYGPQGLEMLVVPASPDKVFVRPYFSQDTIYHVDVNGSIINRVKPGTPLEGFAVNWRNENIVYAGYYGPNPGGSIVKKSTNGGITFTDMTNGYGGCPKYVHPDIRGFAAVGDTVLVAHDGGLSRSFNGMTSIETIGYDISGVDLWGFSSSLKSDIVVAGCDHGPTKIRRFDGDGGWQDRGGGDAGDCTINPANDSLFYYNFNSSTTASGKFIGVLNADNTVTSTSLVGNDGDLNLMEFDPNLYTKVYSIAGNAVKVSDQNGHNPIVFKDFGAPVNRFRIARKDAKTMYVLLQNSIVRKSTDAGITWTVITPTSAQSSGQTVINDIEVGALAGDVWLLYGQVQNNCKVIRTADAGASWTNTTGNLPSNMAKQFVYQRGTNGGLYVYLENAGVWYANNTAATWQQLGTSLPTISYSRNLYTVPAKNKFRMGSSRGAWEHELIETSGLDAQLAFDRNVCDRWSNVVKFRDYSACNGPVTFEWAFPGGQPSASTAEFPSVTYNAAGIYSVTLTIRDANGNMSTQTVDSAIRVINEGEAGLQPVGDANVWDANANTNYGTSELLVMKKDITGTNRIPYLKFDLNGITSTVHSARLQLFIQSSGSATGNAPQWQLWKCTEDGWSETGITWSNKPATSTLLGTITGKSGGMVEWDVTNAVNAELNGDKILSFAVVPSANSVWYLNFNAREVGTPLLRPQLMINAYPAITLTQPVNGDLFDIGSSTTLKANVIDSTGPASVTFLVNGLEKATIAQAPYEWNWNNLQPGTYGIRAKAINSLGFSSISDSITIKVKDTSGILQPVGDAFVRDGSSANANFGTLDVLTVKNDPNSSFSRISYLKFDLSSYSTAATSAKLKLFIKGTANTTTGWKLFRSANDNWTETGITWNNKPDTSTVLGIQPGKLTGMVEWDITSQVNTEIGGDKILTLVVVGTVRGNFGVDFNSREFVTASLRPSLVIEAPPVITLLQPLNRDSLIEKSAITIKAKATDDKKIANVKFFINGEEKATITQAPYEWNWTNQAPGNYGIRAKATDNSNLNAWSDSVTVYVKDTTAPVISCPGNIVAMYDPSICGAQVNYTVTATDNFSNPIITLTSGFASAAVFPLGATTVTHTATDAAGNSANCSFTVTVNAVATTSSLTMNSLQVQYSDKPVFTARVVNGGSPCGINAADSVTFKLGSEILGTVPMQVNGENLEGIYSDRAFLDAPSTAKIVTAEFNNINQAYVVSNPLPVNFTIVKEDAGIHYSGALFVSTISANSGTANVALKATIRDISAETNSPLFDPHAGDIRNATATFINRDNNTVIAANVPLVLATPGDTKTAIASYNWSVNIGNANSQSYTIAVIVNDYYTRNSSADNAVITVSRPLDNFITGGGNLLLNNSSGIMAGDAGSLNDFGFNLKWNNTQSNLQGNLNTIIRRTVNGVEKVYQVKANSMTTMVVDGSVGASHPYPTAVFGARANIQDITNPLSPVSIDGNATLQVSMTDASGNGSPDKIGITIWNKNGSLWYSGNWTGSTAEQILNAGDIVISSSSVNSTTRNFTTSTAQVNSVEKLTVQVSPNPSAGEFKLHIQSNSEESVLIKVTDIHGRLVKKINVTVGKLVQFGNGMRAGTYTVEVRQGKKYEVVKLIKL